MEKKPKPKRCRKTPGAIMGTPTKYRPEYCDMLIEHMGKGYSFETFSVIVGVDRQTIYNWLKTEPNFLDAKKTAFSHAQLFWEKLGIEGTLGDLKGWSTAGWIFNMKNRFGWHDQVKNDETKTLQPILINLPMSGETKMIEMQPVLDADETEG